jgi:F0F1-type ATP synthase assembly protein I
MVGAVTSVLIVGMLIGFVIGYLVGNHKKSS